MHMPTLYWVPQFLSGVISTIVVFYLWRRRSASGAKNLMILLIATAGWSLLGALHKISPELPTKILLAKFQYPFILTVPLALITFTLKYTGRERWLTIRNLILLAIVPVVTLALVWTNESHRLIWKQIWLDVSGPIPIAIYNYGPWFWFYISFAYLLILLSTIWLIQTFIRSPHLYQMQILVMLIGIAAPWLANVIYLLRLSPWPHIDMTPIAFTLSGLAISWGLFWFRISDIVPVARENVLENIPDGVIVLDYHNRIVDLNPAAQEIVSRPVSEVIGQSALKIFVDQPIFMEHLRNVIEAHSEIILRKGDVQRYYDLYTSPLKDKRGRLIGHLITLHDFTGRKHAEEEKSKMEDQLKKAQKMEAIGTLAGGVAHDLNNILSGIVSYPELMLMDLPEDSVLRKPILTIQKSGKRAATIVQDLLTLAQRGVSISEVVNLNHIISEQLKSPEFEKLRSFNLNVKVETNLEKDLLNIKGSIVHLSKTVMNLISNASEAMPKGGKILISTENQYIDKPIRGYDYVKEGNYVTVTVSDNGMGICEEDMDRIFEPFYTKKVMGRSGTGLGMAVVWGTVKDHKGYIEAESSEGKGTTFTLYFPVTREEIVTEKSLRSIEEYLGKGESILIVDDVEEQREIASEMLKKLGYAVTSVSSGKEAVGYLKYNSSDLLVLDMIMDPGIDGLDTYKRIIEIHPNQKAIIASGYSETDRVKEAQRLGAGEYIKKPYMLEKIGLAVKEELEK